MHGKFKLFPSIYVVPTVWEGKDSGVAQVALVHLSTDQSKT